jgi:hypothetical protein
VSEKTVEQPVEQSAQWDISSVSHRLLRLTTQKNSAWVLGMHWYSLIGAQSRRDILLDQRRKKATHFVESSPLKNSAGSVLGVSSLIQKNETRREKLHSAALAFARQHLNDTHILILNVSNEAWWLVASHHGAVVCQTDTWYTDRALVDRHIVQLQSRFLTVYVEDFVWTDLGLDPGQSTHSLSWLFSPESQTQIVLPIPNSPLFKMLVLSGLGVTVLSVSLIYLWVNHTHNRLNHLKLVAQSTAEQIHEPSPYQSHQHESILAMVDMWRTLPLDPSGWLLKRVECERQHDAFRCLAHYKRDQPHANNGQFARAIPTDWQLVADSLDQVSLVRDISLPTQPIDWSEQLFDEDWLTPLQQRQAIFQSLQIGAGEALPMSLTHTERPMFKRSIRLMGPLRSFPALSGLKQPIQWQYASLEIVDQTTLDLTHSHFVLHLVGEIFVPS